VQIWKVELIPAAQRVFKKQIRIIYEVVEDIIKVIAIDKREDMEVYRIAMKRILSMKQG
jgi:hypothetical protein